MALLIPAYSLFYTMLGDTTSRQCQPCLFRGNIERCYGCRFGQGCRCRSVHAVPQDSGTATREVDNAATSPSLSLLTTH